MVATIAALVLVATASAQAADVGSLIALHRAADDALSRGDHVAAGELFTRALALAPEHSTLTYGRACSAARAGEVETALEWLRLAKGRGYEDGALWQWDSDLESLRGDERFRELVRRMRDPAAAERLPYVRRIFQIDVEDYAGNVAIDTAGERCALIVNGCDALRGEIQLVDPHDGRCASVLAQFDEPVWDLAFTPDGRQLAALTWSGQLLLFDIAGGAQARLASALPPEERKFTWPFGALVLPSPDGKRWFVAARWRGGALLDEAGDILRRWEEPLGNYFAVSAAWSPDAKHLAIAMGEEVVLHDVATGSPDGPPVRAGAPVAAVAFHPQRPWIALGLDDGRLRIVDLQTRETVLEERQLEPAFPGRPANVSCVRFSPDGSHVAVSTTPDSSIVVIELKRRGRAFESGDLGGRAGEPTGIAWSLDGSRLWFGYVSGCMQLAEVDLSRERPVGLEFIRAQPPRVSSALAVTNFGGGMLALDPVSGRVRWMRVLAKRGELLQTAQGYFGCDFDDLSGLEIRTDSERDSPVSLTRHAAQLFDPKRVRAAAAGVPLFVPHL